MPAVLTMASTVLCGPVAPKLHGGKVTKNSSAKLKVAGNAVLTATSLSTVPVGECKTVPPPPLQKPCTSVTTVLPVSVAKKLQVLGNGVLLDTLKGTTDGVPPGTLLAVAGQTKLTAL
jgi:hypothetical protein